MWVQTQAGEQTRSLVAQTVSQMRRCCLEEVHPPLLRLEASELGLELGSELGLEQRHRYPEIAEALLKTHQGETVSDCCPAPFNYLINYYKNLPISILSTEDEPWEN